MRHVLRKHLGPSARLGEALVVLLADDAGEELTAEHRRLRRARVAERLRDDGGGGVGERLEAVRAL